MNKAYSRTTWENYPSDNTPLNETNLNHLEIGVDEIDNRVISLDTKKFDKTEAAGLIKSFELDKTTGIITITKYNGSVQTIDTLLEKIAVNFDFDAATQKLIITLDDGTTKEIDLSAFITQYEFLDSDTIAFEITDGKVKAIVKNGSITEDKLQPNFLADIKVETAKAQSYKESAAGYASDAATSAQTASKKADEAASSATSASNSKDLAAQSLSDVETARDNALTQINDALEANTPNFSVDLTTGHLMWQGGRFNFQVDNSTGHLGWEVSA